MTVQTFFKLFEEYFELTVGFFKDHTPSKGFQDQLKDYFKGDFKLPNFLLIPAIDEFKATLRPL